MLKRIGNKLQENKLYCLTFIIGIIIISIIYRLNHVTPFGPQSLLCVDFFHQYGPMLGEFYDRIQNFSGFTYSFNMAMGLPFFRNFLNYLSSPFNIIMLFFSRKNLLTSYSFIIGLKAVVSGVTMVYYLSKKFESKELFLIPIAILYAFQAYFQAYYWNIMWLDGMVFLPLITLGIENIVNKQKWKLYTFSLALLLFANYFIGYMVCIFSVIYFLFYTLYKTPLKIKKVKKEEWISRFKLLGKRCLYFGISSITAGAMVAVFLLPMASSMTSISATGGTIPTSQYYDFQWIDYILGHLTGVDTTVFASDAITNPNISCGILAVALLFLYLLNIDIPLKNKVAYLFILGFFILAFFVPQLDYILHAFHVPNDLPYRYSFLYSFVLLTIATYGLFNIKKLKFPLITISYLFLLSLLVLALQENWEGMTQNMIIINMILLSLYFLFYACYHFLQKYHTLVYLAFIFVAAVDVIVSTIYNWDITQVMAIFYEDYQVTEELLDKVKEQDEELFYRIENTSMLTLNDPSWYNYYGMTTFSSMAYESMAILQHNLGMPGNEINSYYYVQSTPIYDLMFDIKYFIGITNDTTRYHEIATVEETANRFDENVGLIYGVKEDLRNWHYTEANPFHIQNEYMELATGIQNVLEPSMLLRTEEIYSNDTMVVLKYSYKNPGDNLYFYSDDVNLDFVVIGSSLYYKNDNYTTVMEENPDIYYDYVEDYGEAKVINIASGEEEIEIYVGFNTYYSAAFNVYSINQAAFLEARDTLNKYKFDMTSFKESLIKGNITLEENMMVYTSIPYDTGWHVYVDGKEVKTEKLGDALLTFPCEKGTHKITLKYKTPYAGVGLIISGTTLILIFTLPKYGNKLKIHRKEKKKKQK